MQHFLSGYIEGYYGRLFTFEERLGIARKLKQIGASHYLYAPKEDPFHRQEWRKSYPSAWRGGFKNFVAQSRRMGVQVVPGLAPGLSFRYQSRADFNALLRKFGSFAAMGCEEAALLMDDIPVELPKQDTHAFHSLGEAHGLLLQDLWPRLRNLGFRRLWFCPTVYSDYFAPEGVTSSPYLRDLAAFIVPEIEVMWTGRAIVSREYKTEEMSQFKRVVGVAPVIWDNLYANDYCPGKIFLGSFAGRSKSLLKGCRGMMLNPTGLYQTDLFLLDLLGGFLRGFPPQKIWDRTVRTWTIPNEFLKIATFLESPFNRKTPSSGQVQILRQALKPLLWEWKSPLQREWYPYLYSLDADLRLLSRGADKPDEAWIRKKYSPILSRFLVGSAR